MNRNLRNALIIGGILIVLLIIIPAIFGSIFGFRGDGIGMMSGFGWGMLGVGAVLMIAFWVAVIWGIVSLIRWLSYSSGSGPSSMHPMQHNARALQILHERYARGEIGKEEYEQKKRDLGG